MDPLLKWDPYLYDYEADRLRVFAKKGLEVNRLRVSRLIDYKYPDETEGFGFKSVNKLEFVPFVCHVKTKRNGPYSMEYSGISDANLQNLMKDLKNVNSLSLHSRSFNEVARPSCFGTCSLPELKELKISTFNKDGPGYYQTIYFNLFIYYLV